MIEIPQDLARRMAAALEELTAKVERMNKLANEDLSLPMPSHIDPRPARAILTALPKDDPVDEAVAFFERHVLPVWVPGTGDSWATIKAAIACRPAKSESEIRADERKKAEREIAATIDYAVAWHRTGDLATRIRSGAYRTLQE